MQFFSRVATQDLDKRIWANILLKPSLGKMFLAFAKMEQFASFTGNFL